jgi:hypothetical protein
LSVQSTPGNPPDCITAIRSMFFHPSTHADCDGGLHSLWM